MAQNLLNKHLPWLYFSLLQVRVSFSLTTLALVIAADVAQGSMVIRIHQALGNPQLIEYLQSQEHSHLFHT
jgi:hypothetical protein